MPFNRSRCLPLLASKASNLAAASTLSVDLNAAVNDIVLARTAYKYLNHLPIPHFELQALIETKALEAKVLFVPGQVFLPDGGASGPLAVNHWKM
jgi:hypothetical protein